MRIAACISDPVTRETVAKWLEQYCTLYKISSEIASFASPEEYTAARRLRVFDMLFVGLEGPEGFLTARRMREEDVGCKMVFISSTPEYSVKCVRLHFTDYIVMPVEFKQLVRAMKLAGIGA